MPKKVSRKTEKECALVLISQAASGSALRAGPAVLRLRTHMRDWCMEQRSQREESETRDIGIAGMTCDNCVRRVDRALRAVAGVTQVKVDRAAARATVTFDPSQTDIPALHDALLKSGYQPAAVAT